MAGMGSDAFRRGMRTKYRMGRSFNQGYAAIRGVLQGHIKFNSLAGYGCRFGVIELSFARVDGDAEAVKGRMTGDFGFDGNSSTFTPPSSPNDQFERPPPL